MAALYETCALVLIEYIYETFPIIFSLAEKLVFVAHGKHICENFNLELSFIWTAGRDFERPFLLLYFFTGVWFLFAARLKLHEVSLMYVMFSLTWGGQNVYTELLICHRVFTLICSQFLIYPDVILWCSLIYGFASI